MSDPDAMPDPIDQAYVEAEDVLSDDAARAARRARVMAAVASDGAPDAARPGRLRAWRPGGWLAAACAAGLAIVVAVQLYRPADYLPPSKPTAVRQAPAAAPAALPAPATAAKTPTAAPVSSATTQGQAPPANAVLRGEEPASEPPTVVVGSAAAISAKPAAGGLAPAPAPALEPAPPPSPQADAASERAAAAPPPSPQPPRDSVADDRTSVTEMVVTAEKREARRKSVPAAISAFAGRVRQAFDPAARLRDAAAGGRTKEMEALLQHGAAVDAQDADGETALMKSVESDQPAAAALLVRRGASLDQTNHAGESARDMATAKGDADLDQALGLSP